jgi:oligopeptidase B
MNDTTSPTPPIAAVRPHQLAVHDHERMDNYYWLREKSNPEVIAYLEAENAHTAAVMAHTQALQQRLYEEMVGRIQESDQTVPAKDGDYYYYSRTEEGKQYDIYCRKRGHLAAGQEADEEVLLDLNELAQGHSYCKLGIYRVSPDHQLLAYSLDTSGAEAFTIFFKDLASGEVLPDQIDQTFYAAEWANDNRTFFYTTQNEAWRSYKLFRHTLGADPSQDPLIYHETDDGFSVFLSKSKDKAYLFLVSGNMETTEVHYLDADRPTAGFTLVEARRQGIRYHLKHHTGTFYIVTNEDAPNHKVMMAPAANPVKAQWQEVIAHRPDFLIDDVELFAHHLVLYGRQNGLRTLHITHLANNETHEVTFAEPVYTFSQGDNLEFDTHLLRFNYTSLVTPESVFDYDMNTGQRELKKQKPVPGYEPDAYQSERIWATAGDGTQVPISLVYRRGMVRDGQAPCLLYGYGSYGATMDPTFNANRVSLLDRGFIFALAHIRGGQEMGRAWYDQGKFLHKKNTFTDFIACARRLIEANYTSSHRLAIMGRSAGGLLIGAVVTMAPELFQAAVAGVPFVDVVTTMLDESIPLTVIEFEEWGNPQDKVYYDYMLSYSPYDNITARAYPNMLITAGLNDPRVQYWEPAKFAARLRACKRDHNRLLLKTNMGAGHFSFSGRYDYLQDVAFEFAFILDVLGFTE